MRGQVLGVDQRTGEGMVAGDDGQRYRFTPTDWAHRGEPATGVTVDFEADQGRALNIFPLPVAAPAGHGVPAAASSATEVRSDRNKYVAAVLAFLFGPLGIHRFYTGRTGSGIMMLVLSVTMVGLLLTVPWGFVDMVRYLIMSDAEFTRRYPRD